MQKIDIRVVKARTALILAHAFFGSLAMRLIPVERSDVETMATDGKFLFYSRKFLDAITASVTTFVVAHEVLHCALGHHCRRGNRDHKLWNIACDYVVNWLLKEAGFTLPDWVLVDARFAGMKAEQVYEILRKEQQAQQQPQPQPEEPDEPEPQGSIDHMPDHREDWTDGDPEDEDETDGGGDNTQDDDDSTKTDNQQSGDDQCDSDPTDCTPTKPSSKPEDGESTTLPGKNSPSEGSGDGSTAEATSQAGSGTGEDSTSSASGSGQFPPTHGDPGRCGEILDAAPSTDQAALEEAAGEWQVYTRQAVNIARKQGEGRVPGFIEEIIDTLNTPQTNWREQLRNWVSPSETKDYSWRNPNRRMMSRKLYTPGLVSDGINHVAFAVDSSGSIDHKWLEQSGAEVQAALDEGALDKVTVLFVDTVVHKATEYTRGETIDFTVLGRGGTAFSPAFDWLEQNAPDIAGCVYLTDLECTDFGPTPPFPVLWAVYGYDARTRQQWIARAPFGDCVELSE